MSSSKNKKECYLMQSVKEIMTSGAKTCKIDHPLSCTLEILKRENCGGVPIVDASNKVVAMLTDRDIAMCLLEKGKMMSEMPVKECMLHKPLISIKADDSVHQAVLLMEKHQIKRLPVVDDQMHCVGIVAQADIVLKGEDHREAVELVKAASREKAIAR
jgi:CBS domain-containing protein